MISSFESLDTKKFEKKTWDRPGGGGGTMAVMKGEVFEKVGVNISVVHGKFSEEFRKKIPGTENNANFWAAGISIVAYEKSKNSRCSFQYQVYCNRKILVWRRL